MEWGFMMSISYINDQCTRSNVGRHESNNGRALYEKYIALDTSLESEIADGL